MTINLPLCTWESVGDGPLGTHPLGFVPSVTKREPPEVEVIF